MRAMVVRHRGSVDPYDAFFSNLLAARGKSLHETQSDPAWLATSARLADGRCFRTLAVLDLYTRDSLALVADRSLRSVKVAGADGNHRR